MATAYNPKISTNLLSLYFDFRNVKSFNNLGTITNLVGSNISSLVATQDINGYVTQSNISTNVIYVPDLNDTSKLTIFFSIKKLTNTTGAVFNLYKNSAYFNNPSANTSVDTNVFGSNALSSNSYNITYTTSNNTSIDTNIVGSNALSSNSYNITYTTSNNTSVDTNVFGSNALSSSSYNITYTTSNNTSIDTNVFGSNSISEEIYNDNPRYDVSALINNDSIKIIFKDSDNFVNYDFGIESSYADIFAIVFSKNSSNSIKLYQNGNFVGSTGNSSLNTFGDTLSILSRMSQGNMAKFPVRCVGIYKKELSQDEIKQLSYALNIQ